MCLTAREFIIIFQGECNMELPRTYVPFKDWKEKSKQTEYTEKTPLLNKDVTLNAKGWARHDVFQ